MRRNIRDARRSNGGASDGADKTTGTDLLAPSTRRGFLQTTAGAGTLATGLGRLAVGSGAAAGIPTPWLTVDGNRLRDPDGNTVILRGVNVVDPARAAEEWREDIEPLIELATDPEQGWHSRVIRLPMQPQDIGDHNPGTAAPTPGFTEAQLETYLADYVDPAVQAAEDAGAYIMLDYHRHYPEGPDWDSPELDEEIRLFWNHVAPRYSDRSHVIYELYNEPNTPYPGAGNPNDGVAVTEQRAAENFQYWRETAQPWVDLIRSSAPRNIVVIGSPRWSQFTYWASEYPFEGENLAYSGHVYAHEGLRPLSETFGEPAEDVPVFMSEIGYGTEGAPHLVGTNEQEGQEFLEFFDNYDVHWQAWCFDHTWSPGMLNRDYEVDSPHGRLFKQRLRAMQNADVPGTDGTDGTSGAGGAGGTVDTTPPSIPGNLSSPARTEERIEVAWDASTDSSGSGLAGYRLTIDGQVAQEEPADATSATVVALAPDTSYEVGVSAVDGAGNESPTATVTVATEPAEDTAGPGSGGGDGSGSGSDRDAGADTGSGSRSGNAGSDGGSDADSSSSWWGSGSDGGSDGWWGSNGESDGNSGWWGSNSESDSQSDSGGW